MVSSVRETGRNVVMADTQPASCGFPVPPCRRSPQTPLRQFLRTETGSAAILLGARVAALIWANIERLVVRAGVVDTELLGAFGGASISIDLREFVNYGLMTFFFLVVGLGARREFDIGELRDRQARDLPLLAGIGA